MLLKEIAEIVGVSPAAVSLVMKNKPGVSQEKRHAILELLKANGYEVQFSAPVTPTSFRFVKYYRHSHLVNGNPGFINRIIEALERECRSHGIDFLITTVNAEIMNNNQISSLIKSDPADGIIFLGTELMPEDYCILQNIKKPVIVVDNAMENTRYSSVTMNNFSAIHSVLDYLEHLGHKPVGFLASTIPSANFNARERAFRHIMKSSGLSVPDDYIYRITPTLENSYLDVLDLLRKNTKFPSALVAINDCIALGAMRAFQEYGIKIPDDISIIGFDNIDYSTISTPSLTTIHVSCKSMGIVSVELLCSMVSNPSLYPFKVNIDTTLIPRDSTCEYKKHENPFVF